MIQYENESGEYLKLKIKNDNLNNYWIFINICSDAIDQDSNYSMYLEYQAYIKSNTIRNSQVIVKEGINSIYAYMHRVDPNIIDSDQTFIELSIQSYFSEDNVRKTKNLGYRFLEKKEILKQFAILANTLKIDTNIDSLIELLLPSLSKINILLATNNEEMIENTFFEYQQLINKVLISLRKKVYKKKYQKY